MSAQFNKLFSILVALVLLICRADLAIAAQTDSAANDTSSEVKFVQDGQFTNVIELPTYEWFRSDLEESKQFKGIVVFVHGFTMHGRRFSRLAQCLALKDYYCVSYDMYGFGRNFFTEKRPLIDGLFSKRRINYKKSHKKLVELTKTLHKQHPTLPIYLIGESMGATPCLQVVSEEPNLVNGIVLSAPAIQINPLLFAHPMSALEATVPVALSPHLNMRLHHFVNHLLSLDKEVKKDIKQDKEIRRSVTWFDLGRTQAYVAKALAYAPLAKDDPHVLFMIGARDLVVLPSDAMVLYGLIKSKNKKFVRLKKRSHLLTETNEIKPDTVATIFEWLDNIESKNKISQATKSNEPLN